ncbi:MAG: phosphoglucosamine mutase [Actinomycetia bacterium]|nr:phosphoglucosamine mutase [Actinomycetes bacterium]
MTAERTLFGTDGVRGVVGEDMTTTLATQLGRAFALFTGGGEVLIGRDTRASGEALTEALAEGIASGGGRAVIGGVLPTAAVALLAPELGAVVSASHNPAEYNGVKFFGRSGRKLAEADEHAVESLLDADPRPGGSITAADGLLAQYRAVIAKRFGTTLAGLRIACDCANGALSQVAPALLEELGAEVTAVGNSPDGGNINAGCGSTELGLLLRTLREGEFDLGVAFDGDGDRLLACDHTAQPVDGDEIVAILALHLDVELVVVTTVTNAGFYELMGQRGIRVVTTDVGDRHVAEALEREGGVLGGEQSGHIIVRDRQVTGDGLAASLLLGGAVVERGQTLRELAAVMPKWEQEAGSVAARTRSLPEALLGEIERLNEVHAGEARVHVRPSGTEPVVRILVQARERAVALDLYRNAVRLVESEVGSSQAMPR